jgi:polyhydroxyalkanoate synthesis regulator phasin
MKAKTIIELATLSAAAYNLSKEMNIVEKLTDLKDQGKDKINSFMKEKMLDENGNEMEFMEKLSAKANEAKEELENKIGELVAVFYDKVNIAHVDKIKSLQNKIEQLNKDIAFSEARITKLEKKKE